MWKDFFYYSKSERRSILVLVGIGILLLFSGTWIQLSERKTAPVVDSLSVDSFCVREYQRRTSYDSLQWQHSRRTRVKPVLADFDPNTADSAALSRLGLPAFIARRIVNYRTKGGVFRTPEDLERIYGLSHEQYETLRPYIVIDQQRLEAQSTGTSIPARQKEYHQSASKDSIHYQLYTSSYQKYPEGTVIDLNAADTSQLKRIPGIGSGLARMIVAYRNRLGGYASVSQLHEVARIDTTVNHWFKIDSCIFRPLRINHARLDQLRNHPYMNFYKAKVILEYRRKRGKIKGLSQLSMFQEFTEKDLQKLKPYLDFE